MSTIRGLRICRDQLLEDADYAYCYEDEILRLKFRLHWNDILPQRVYLQDLTSVNLWGDITVCLSAFRECKQLEKLTVFHTTVSDQTYSFSNSLKTVSISLARLKESTVSDLVAALPTTVKDLTLASIGIGTGDYCAVHDISTISRLINLECLVLTHSSSTNRTCDCSMINNDPDLILPEDMSALTRLTNVCFSGCGLEQLPDSFYTLTRLRSIHLHYNRISSPSILEKLSNVSSLVLLELDHNTMTGTLPPVESVSKLARLEALTMMNNDITDGLTDEWIESMPSLRNLSLDNNTRLEALLDWNKRNIVTRPDTNMTQIRYRSE